MTDELSYVVWNLPALLLAPLFAGALLLYLVRAYERTAALLAALLVGALLWWLGRVNLNLATIQSLGVVTERAGAALEIPQFGLTLAVKEGMIPVLVIYFGLVGSALVLTLRAGQGRSFVPFALLLLAGYSAMTLITSGPIAPAFLMPLFLVGLTSLSAFVLQAGRIGFVSGAVRTLLPPLLAFPLFLLATWYINEQIPLNPQDEQALRTTGTLLAMGLLLILAPFPIQSAHSTAAQTAPPVVAATVSLLYQMATLYLFSLALDLFPPLATSSPFYIWLTWAGILTAVWGGFAAVGTAHPGRLLGYASLHDWGLILLVLAIPDGRRWPLVVLLFLLRAISLLTAAAGLSVMEARVGSLTPSRLQGVGQRLYWNTGLYFLGGLGLVGFPLSAGFTGHWTALQIISAGDWRLSTVVLIASAATMVGFVRLVRLLYAHRPDPGLADESRLSSSSALVICAVSVGLVLVPQALDPLVDWLLTAFG